jgi:hypothetical protein
MEDGTRVIERRRDPERGRPFYGRAERKDNEWFAKTFDLPLSTIEKLKKETAAERHEASFPSAARDRVVNFDDCFEFVSHNHETMGTTMKTGNLYIGFIRVRDEYIDNVSVMDRGGWYYQNYHEHDVSFTFQLKDNASIWNSSTFRLNKAQRTRVKEDSKLFALKYEDVDGTIIAKSSIYDAEAILYVMSLTRATTNAREDALQRSKEREEKESC